MVLGWRFDAHHDRKDAMNPRFQDAMHLATRLARNGQLAASTEVIQRALGAALPPAAGVQPTLHQEFDVSDPVTREGLPLAGLGRRLLGALQAPPTWLEGLKSGELHLPGHSEPVSIPQVDREGTGESTFVWGSHNHGSLTRQYKLFVPPGNAGRSLPLVVMLHGCTQDPDDFAAGTDMNGLAVEHACAVLYPAQAQQANPSRCWNWFKHNHQGRGRGEAACIASMTQAVMKAQAIDRDRVYIAGLSAGGAMAASVGAAYPDIFAAVGVHSGLAPGAARNLQEALMAMQGNVGGPVMRAAMPRPRGDAPSPGPVPMPLPVIVFHGDQDATVHPRNGERVVAAALGTVNQHSSPLHATRSPSQVVEGTAQGGRAYTRRIHEPEAGCPAAEHWIVHGAGHAWSGGRDAGSFTDPAGPDASREMLRFFLANPRRPGS